MQQNHLFALAEKVFLKDVKFVSKEFLPISPDQGGLPNKRLWK
jgi:hypothetical protein